MSFLGAIAATVPVLGTLFDPELAAQRKLEDEEKQYMQSAQRAEAAHDAAAAVRFRGQARVTHNQRIRLMQDAARKKAADCRKHGWTDAEQKHEQAAQQLEYEVWADTDSAGSSGSTQQPKTAAPMPTNTAVANATATPPSAAPSSMVAAPVADGTSWPPQTGIASAASPTASLPPPPSYNEATHPSQNKTH